MTKEQFLKELRILKRKVEDLEHDNKALWHIVRELEIQGNKHEKKIQEKEYR